MCSMISRWRFFVSLDATVSEGKRFALVIASRDLDTPKSMRRYRRFKSSLSSSNVTVCDCDMMFK